MLIYEITLAVLLALFLALGTASGMLYNLLYVYLIARLATEAIRFYLAYRHGDFLFAEWPNLGLDYWLANSLRTVFFMAILWFVLSRFLPFQLPPNTAMWVKLQMVGLPLIAIALLWIPTARSNWPQAMVMTLGAIALITMMLMQQKTTFKNAIKLANPFNEPAMVVSAGASPLYNHHYFVRAQRYAADMFTANYNRYAHRQKTLTAFTSFGVPLLAPADGEVVALENSLPDQAIGTTNAKQPVGNYVVIKMAEHHYVLLAHLQTGSVTVNLGDYVKQGDVIAAVGNSGNTSEPHLHIQVQDHPDFRQVTQTFPIYYESNGQHQLARTKMHVD